MKVRLVAPPWGAPSITKEIDEAARILGDGVWADSSVRFYAERDAKMHAGKRAPKGMQATLNEVIADKMFAKGWEGGYGDVAFSDDFFPQDLRFFKLQQL